MACQINTECLSNLAASLQAINNLVRLEMNKALLLSKSADDPKDPGKLISIDPISIFCEQLTSAETKIKAREIIANVARQLASRAKSWIGGKTPPKSGWIIDFPALDDYFLETISLIFQTNTLDTLCGGVGMGGCKFDLQCGCVNPATVWAAKNSYCDLPWFKDSGTFKVFPSDIGGTEEVFPNDPETIGAFCRLKLDFGIAPKHKITKNPLCPECAENNCLYKKNEIFRDRNICWEFDDTMVECQGVMWYKLYYYPVFGAPEGLRPTIIEGNASEYKSINQANELAKSFYNAAKATAQNKIKEGITQVWSAIKTGVDNRRNFVKAIQSGAKGKALDTNAALTILYNWSGLPVELKNILTNFFIGGHDDCLKAIEGLMGLDPVDRPIGRHNAVLCGATTDEIGNVNGCNTCPPGGKSNNYNAWKNFASQLTKDQGGLQCGTAEALDFSIRPLSPQEKVDLCGGTPVLDEQGNITEVIGGEGSMIDIVYRFDVLKGWFMNLVNIGANCKKTKEGLNAIVGILNATRQPCGISVFENIVRGFWPQENNQVPFLGLGIDCKYKWPSDQQTNTAPDCPDGKPIKIDDPDCRGGDRNGVTLPEDCKFIPSIPIDMQVNNLSLYFAVLGQVLATIRVGRSGYRDTSEEVTTKVNEMFEATCKK